MSQVAKGGKKKKIKRKTSAPPGVVELPSGSSGSAVPEAKLSPEAAAVMKRLTRILRSAKSVRNRIESGEAEKESCLLELNELSAALICESNVTDLQCVSAFKKLSSQLTKITNLAKSLPGKKSIIISPAPEKTVNLLSPPPLYKGPPPPPPPAQIIGKQTEKKKKIRKSGSLVVGRVDGEIIQFVELLKSVHLNQFVPELSNLGIERLSDLKFVKEDDLKSTSLKPIQKKKLLALYNADFPTKELSRRASEISPNLNNSNSYSIDANSPQLIRRSVKSGIKSSQARERRGSMDVVSPRINSNSNSSGEEIEREKREKKEKKNPIVVAASPPSADEGQKKVVRKIMNPKRSASTSSVIAKK